MPFIGELPGLYYDRVKDKYFKIHADHDRPEASEYSQASVKKKMADEQAQKDLAAKKTFAERQTVRRSKILSSHIAGGIDIFREAGLNHSKADARDSLVQGYIDGHAEVLRSRFDKPQGPFAYDCMTDSLLMSNNQDNGHGVLHTRGPLMSNQPDSASIMTVATGIRMNHITSTSISPARVAMATTIGGTRGATVLILPLEHKTVRLDSETQTIFNHAKADIWGCAANPFVQDEAIFAVAHTGGVNLYRGHGQGTWNTTQLLLKEPYEDTRAVEWLTPTLLSVGNITGSVQLYDIRAQDSALRLQHPKCITEMRCVNPHSLVICGIPDALAMYDLRMPVFDAKLRRWDERSAKLRRFKVNTSLPVLRYDYKSDGLIRPGFDIDTTSGVIAILDGKTSKIQMYSLQSGSKGKSFAIQDPQDKQLEQSSLQRTRLLFINNADGADRFAEDGWTYERGRTVVWETDDGTEQRWDIPQDFERHPKRGQLLATYGRNLIGYSW